MEACERRLLLASNPLDVTLSPLSAVPVLNSLPGAHKKLFLDFNGHGPVDDWLPGFDVEATEAYDRDKDATTFTHQELKDIQDIWVRVAEKFSPFNINVTTVDPGNENENETAVVIFGGAGSDWAGPGTLGIATLGGFVDDELRNVCFVFTKDIETSALAADVAAHEAGHLFTLQHQQLWDEEGGELLAEYSPGDQWIGPIMGHGGLTSRRSIWWAGPNRANRLIPIDPEKGQYFQDDLAILNNVLGLRGDDHGNTQFSATELKGINGSVSTKGVIEQPTDREVFQFTTTAGTVKFDVTTPLGGMLDASLMLTDAFGNVLTTETGGRAVREGASLSESLTWTVSEGTYFVTVYSEGNHGDVGQWELSGQLPLGVITNQGQTLLVSGTDFDDLITINVRDGNYILDVNGDVQTLDPGSIEQFNILVGDGNDVVTIGPGVPKCYILGGAGADTLTGGDANDTITGSGGNDLIFGGKGDDRLAGSAGHDQLLGGDGRDRLYGDAGNDVMRGGAGVDRLWGGDDHDVLSGESSADKLYGELGNDSIFGGNGNDLLNGGVGLDYLWGQSDDDSLYARDGAFDLVSGGTGRDVAQTEDEDTQESLEELLA